MTTLILISLFLTVVVNFLMTAIIFSRGWKQLYNILFSILTLSVSIWCIAIAGFFAKEIFTFNINWIAWTHFSALTISLVFLIFASIFPNKILKKPLLYFVALIPFFILSYYLFYTEFIIGSFSGLNYELGGGYVLYQIILSTYFLTGYFLLFMQFKRSDNLVTKQQLKYVLLGSIVSSGLAIITDLALPFVGIFEYTWLGPLFTLILVIAIFIAILRYQLFNIKVIVSEMFSLIVISLLIVDIFLTESLTNLIIKSFVTLSVAFFLYFFIRAIYKIETLAKELGETNDRQEKLIHFIGHEVKGYLTKSEGAFAGIVEGDYGAVSQEIKDLTVLALKEDRKGVKAVTDILRASNQKKGTVNYEMKPFDFKQMVSRAVAEIRPEVEAKGLKINLNVEMSPSYGLNGDENQLEEHLVRNLLKNAINYTPSGSITVSLSHEENKILFSVKDTGIGINTEDKTRLFTEGGRGKESTKINVTSTGYGLFIAKGIVEAHHGRISVDSPGSGQGSTFFVELPTY